MSTPTRRFANDDDAAQHWLILLREGDDDQRITVPAVERHVTSIFSKLDLRHAPEDHRRVLAVLEFLKRS